VSSKEKKTGSTGSLHQQFGVPSAHEEEETMMLDHPSYEELQAQLTAAEDKSTQAEEKAAQLWERLLRLQADMDNTQRRVERDIANAHKYALEKFVLELLPVIDSLERAIASHADEGGNTEGSLLDGVSMTLKMFHAALVKFDVEPVDPLGGPFNPELHQAVSTQESSHVKPGTVLNVLQKGYLLNKRLVRAALVVVAK